MLNGQYKNPSKSNNKKKAADSSLVWRRSPTTVSCKILRKLKKIRCAWYFKPVQRYSAGSADSNPVYICEPTILQTICDLWYLDFVQRLMRIRQNVKQGAARSKRLMRQVNKKDIRGLLQAIILIHWRPALADASPTRTMPLQSREIFEYCSGIKDAQWWTIGWLMNRRGRHMNRWTRAGTIYARSDSKL